MSSTYDPSITEVREAAGAGWRGGYGVGEQIFLWVAWTLAFAFWAFSMSTFFGIARDISEFPANRMPGSIGAGGAGWLAMEVVGVVILGAVMMWGYARYLTRDRRMDAVTEAATAKLYDDVERAGGDDMVSRSPDVRAPEDRGPRPAGGGAAPF